MASGAGYWEGAVIVTVVALISLRPLEWVKERGIPHRAASRLTVELAEGATSASVLEEVERHGDLLALRRDGRRLEIEVRVGSDQRRQLLGHVSEVDGVEEARWHS